MPPAKTYGGYGPETTVKVRLLLRDFLKRARPSNAGAHSKDYEVLNLKVGRELTVLYGSILCNIVNSPSPSCACKDAHHGLIGSLDERARASSEL